MLWRGNLADSRPQLFLFEAVGNPTFGQIVGGQFDLDAIARKDFNVITPYFSRNVGEDVKPVIEIDSKHRVGQRFGYRAFHFD